MKPGTQIAYIPTHAKGDIKHKDVQFGFVMSERPQMESHFCRYWQSENLGQLRTTANSELTPDYCLVEHQSVPQDLVEVTMDKIRKEVNIMYRTVTDGPDGYVYGEFEPLAIAIKHSEEIKAQGNFSWVEDEKHNRVS